MTEKRSMPDFGEMADYAQEWREAYEEHYYHPRHLFYHLDMFRWQDIERNLEHIHYMLQDPRNPFNFTCCPDRHAIFFDAMYVRLDLSEMWEEKGFGDLPRKWQLDV